MNKAFIRTNQYYVKTRLGNLIDATLLIQALGGKGLLLSDKATLWPARWAWQQDQEAWLIPHLTNTAAAAD